MEWYRLSRFGLVGQDSADGTMQDLGGRADGDRSNCIERTGGDITIHDNCANIVETEISGITARFGGGFRSDWGEVEISGAWRRMTAADRRIAGNMD